MRSTAADDSSVSALAITAITSVVIMIPGSTILAKPSSVGSEMLSMREDGTSTLVIGSADFGSGSFRNQQRAGLRLAYIESGWRRVNPR